jgi:guanylate kinase
MPSSITLRGSIEAGSERPREGMLVGAPTVPGGRGLLLYGSPTAGLDTTSAILSTLDSRFVLYQRLKAGEGRTDGYRMVDLDEFVRADEAGELLHAYSRYGALYGVDRAGLASMLEDVVVPIVHVGQLDGIQGIRAAAPGLAWTTVCLWCSRGEASRRLRDRIDPQAVDRLKAWDEASAELAAAGADAFDLIINTAATTPEQAPRK